MIPFKFSKHLLNILKGDRIAIISFINMFLIVNTQPIKSWKKFENKEEFGILNR